MAKEIKVITVGEISEQAKMGYAEALARALMATYGKAKCIKILDALKNS